jgi:hypothetical protein
MTRHIPITQPELAAVMAISGLVLGLLYFAALKRSVGLLVGGRCRLWPLALTLGRIGAAGAVLFVAARFGAAPLLAAFIGFLAARAVALRAERRAR